MQTQAPDFPFTTVVHSHLLPDEAGGQSARFPWRVLIAVLLVALLGRILLLATGSVSFHSDEAVVGLMARHILEGERPVFFYGQAYMGSLDPWLVAVGFRLFGDTVATIRLVQAALYLVMVATGVLAAWRLSGRAIVTLVAGLVLAIPPVLVAVYTAATLGGYNETLIFGHLLILLGYDVSHAHRRSWWRWLLLGLIAGLAWWTNGLIVAFALPVGLLVLYRVARPAERASGPGLVGRAAPLLLALVGFFAGSAPWWVFNLENDWAALAFYVAQTEEGRFAGNAVPSLPLDQRALGLLFLGLPTLIGMRFPWQPSFFAPVVGAVVVFIYGAAFFRLLRGWRGPDRPRPLNADARGLLLGMVGLFGLLFFVSKFSIDPTGRYFLPLVFPFAVTLGALADMVWHSRARLWAVGLVAVVLAYNAAGQVAAAFGPVGLTTQFNLDSHIPNEYDDDLIAYLDEHGLYAGYATYWVTFRLAFLTDERMQYSSALPYKPNLEYTEADERYPAYKAAADGTDQVAYITANVREVQERLEAVFADWGLSYERATVGPYTIYHDFSPYVPRPPLPLAD